MVETMYKAETMERECFGERVPGWVLSEWACRLRAEWWEGSDCIKPFHPPGTLAILLVTSSVSVHAEL